MDFSQCKDAEIAAKMRSKEFIVKEALLNENVEFGSVHRQSRKHKAMVTKNEIGDIAERESKINERIIDRLKGYIIQKYEDINLSKIDKTIGTYIHTLSAEPISKEDFFYDRSVLDVQNFLKGER